MHRLFSAGLSLICALSMQAIAQAPQPDISSGAWYMGLPIQTHSLFPAALGGTGPEAPTDERPDLTLYMTGPVNDQARSLPMEVEIPTPDGGVVILPRHDNTAAEMVPYWDMHDGFGFFVLRGPHGNETNVRVRPMPEGSLVGEPLAYEINFHGTWVKLNNHVAIEAGLRLGLLELRPFYETPIAVFWTDWDL